MRDFGTSFLRFYAEEAVNLVVFPKAKALFEKEITVLFNGFQKYLSDHYMSHKGLTMKLFKGGLRDRGFVLVSRRK